MARNQQRSGPAFAADNQARMMSFGTPTAPTMPDFAAIADNAVEANSPEISSAVTVDQPIAPTEPAPAPNPAPEPEPESAQAAAPEAAAPAPGQPEPDDIEKMSPEEVRKLARNQKSLIGRHSDEVGTYRKLFDKMLSTQLQQPVQPPQPQPNPTEKFLSPRLDDTAKQELIALQLTDPEKYEEVMFLRFQLRQQAVQQQHAQVTRQQELIAEFQKVQDVVTSPDFATWEKTLPPHVVETAKHDPNTLRWVVNQFQSSRGQPQAAPPPASHQSPADRVVRLGTAAGAPASGNPERSKHIFTLREIAELQLNRPDEYIARQAEIAQAYHEGRVR